MNKIIFFFALVMAVSCSKHKKNSIALGVEQTVKIPVEYVSVSAGIKLRDSNASAAEKKGYKKLTQTVQMLKKLGYKKDQLEINSGEVRNQSYRKKQRFQYSSSLKFDIKDLDKIDAIRRSLLQKGVNSFDIKAYKNEKEDSLYDRSYRQAIGKARKKAKSLLKNQRRKIGNILTISENVKDTFNTVSAKQKKSSTVYIRGTLATNQVTPLFHKKYYKKKIEFNIKFALN